MPEFDVPVSDDNNEEFEDSDSEACEFPEQEPENSRKIRLRLERQKLQEELNARQLNACTKLVRDLKNRAPEDVCELCNKVMASIWCKDCKHLFCKDCSLVWHGNKWSKDHATFCYSKEYGWDPSPRHFGICCSCPFADTSSRTATIMGLRSTTNCTIASCDEHLNAVLIQHGYFLGQFSSRAIIAFSEELLEHYRMCTLHNGVTHYGFLNYIGGVQGVRLKSTVHGAFNAADSAYNKITLRNSMLYDAEC